MRVNEDGWRSDSRYLAGPVEGPIDPMELIPRWLFPSPDPDSPSRSPLKRSASDLFGDEKSPQTLRTSASKVPCPFPKQSLKRSQDNLHLAELREILLKPRGFFETLLQSMKLQTPPVPSSELERDVLYPEASTAQAKKRNRYPEVLPTKEGLVRLQMRSDPSTDYINANFFEGMIITQGPICNEKIDTVQDMLLVAWEQEIEEIVVLTEPLGLNSKGQLAEKTFPYWNPTGKKCLANDVVYDKRVGPEGKHLQLRVLTDTPEEKTTPEEHYTIQDMELSLDGKQRKIRLWRYRFWDDYKAGKPNVLGEMCCQLNQKPTRVMGHCSAGVGRAGTFAIINYFVSRQEIPNLDQIISMILHLRQRRPLAVMTWDQLKLIFQTLVEINS